jgi:hypothetical protein
MRRQPQGRRRAAPNGDGDPVLHHHVSASRAREDTELFPLLRGIVSLREYDAMAEDFEKKERQMFGAAGFETMVHRVAAIEQSIGIADLAQFTPQ